MKKLFVLTLMAFAAALAPLGREAHAEGTTYYVSPIGNDANPGTSTTQPWKTIAKVNATAFKPGDKILFQGGRQFSGALSFDEGEGGTSTQPITISSYGSGQATIAAGDRAGLSAYNAGGYVVSNLRFVGSGSARNRARGIGFYTDLDGDVKLEYLRVDNVTVNGFHWGGVEIGGWNGTTGYRDVRITNVTAYDNGWAGIIVYGKEQYSHADVYVRNVRTYNNPGIPGEDFDSGHGIVLTGVDGGTVEKSLVYNNGWLCSSRYGPAGISAYMARRITIQSNESYNNRTGGSADGIGIDLDEAVSDSLVQYNYTHGNDGSGFMVLGSGESGGSSGNVVRYNVSENDARKLPHYSSILIAGGVRDSDVYNNTVYVTASPRGTPRALHVANFGIEGNIARGVRIRNNIFQAAGGIPLVEVSRGQLAGGADITFQGNNYYGGTGRWSVIWGGTAYTSLPNWRAATGQERVNGADSGTALDPKLTAPGGGGTMGTPARLTSLTAYRLQRTSPLIDVGLDLPALFGTNPGSRDYYGNRVPQGPRPDVGMHELVK